MDGGGESIETSYGGEGRSPGESDGDGRDVDEVETDVEREGRGPLATKFGSESEGGPVGWDWKAAVLVVVACCEGSETSEEDVEDDDDACRALSVAPAALEVRARPVIPRAVVY